MDQDCAVEGWHNHLGSCHLYGGCLHNSPQASQRRGASAGYNTTTALGSSSLAVFGVTSLFVWLVVCRLVSRWWARRFSQQG